MRIGGFLPTTLLDYPGHIACTIFTQCCNLRCPFCQNGSLVLPDLFEPPLSEEEILGKIRKRSSILEGVCISGGEPTLQPDLKDFIDRIRALGLKVKLDTNGSRPEILEALLKEQLLDYIAMDVKAAPSNYARVCGLLPAAGEGDPSGPEDPSSDDHVFAPYRRSIDLIMHSGIEYEFRTTLVRGLHTQKGMYELASWLENARAWYLQSYEESSDVIALFSENAPACESFSLKELEEFLSIAREFVPSAALRGVEE